MKYEKLRDVESDHLQLVPHTTCSNHRRLAVVLPERVALYELPDGTADAEMRYRLAGSVLCNAACGGLLLMDDHLITCQASLPFWLTY